jgi:predicted NAD/FAD-binding protein
MNPVTYPNFIQFLKLKKIPILETEMSFSVSRDAGAFEWSGSSLPAVFSQTSNLWNLGMYRTLFDIIRFNTFATDLLDMEETPELRAMSISTYLDQNHYCQEFRDNYLIVTLIRERADGSR